MVRIIFIMEKDELRQFRERIGLSQGELSKQLSVAGNTVSRWELGERKIPAFLPLALETIERRLSGSTVGSKTDSTVGSKPKNAVIKSMVFLPDTTVSNTDERLDYLGDEDYRLSSADAGLALNLKPRTVREKAEKGELHGKQGKQNHWFFRQADVLEFKNRRGKE